MDEVGGRGRGAGERGTWGRGQVGPLERSRERSKKNMTSTQHPGRRGAENAGARRKRGVGRDVPPVSLGARASRGATAGATSPWRVVRVYEWGLADTPSNEEPMKTLKTRASGIRAQIESRAFGAVLPPTRRRVVHSTGSRRLARWTHRGFQRVVVPYGSYSRHGRGDRGRGVSR